MPTTPPNPWFSCQGTMAMLILGTSSILYGEEPTAKEKADAIAAARPTVSITDVRQERNKDAKRNWLEVKFAIVPPVEPGATAGQWVLTKAEDDLGTDLLGKNEDAAKSGGFFPPFRDFAPLSKRESYRIPFSATTRLAGPPKAAQTIKTLSGEFRFLIPSRDAAAKLVMPNFMGHPPGKVEAAALEAAGIEMKLEVDRPKNEAFHSPATPGGFQLIQLPAPEFPGTTPFRRPFDDKNFTKVFLRFNRDPSAVVADVAFFDADDKPLPGSGTTRGSSTGKGEYRSYHFEKAPPASARMEIYFWTDKATVRVPFEVKDTQIP